MSLSSQTSFKNPVLCESDHLLEWLQLPYTSLSPLPMVHQDCNLALLIGGSLCGLAGVGISTKPGRTLVCRVPASFFTSQGLRLWILLLNHLFPFLYCPPWYSRESRSVWTVRRWILHKPWSLSAPLSQESRTGSQVTTVGSSAHEFVLLQTGQWRSGAFSQSNQWKGKYTKGMKGAESVSLSQGGLEQPNGSGNF